MRRSTLWPTVTALSAIALALVAAPAAQQEHAGQYSQADITFGMRVYGETCVACHGPDGDAVDGVDFRTGQFRSAGSDFELGAIIRNGIPDTAMVPGDYTESEVTALIAYLRTMGTFDASDVLVGDADRGRELYLGTGDCASCHRIGNEGSRAAPNLTEIGAVRTAGMLADTLVDPSGSMLPINRPVRIVTRDGTLITGRRLNEDTYTVQIISDDERLLSLDKSDLREFTVLTTSSMPSYEETLTEQERADVLAFLLTLRGI